MALGNGDCDWPIACRMRPKIAARTGPEPSKSSQGMNGKHAGGSSSFDRVPDFIEHSMHRETASSKRNDQRIEATGEGFSRRIATTRPTIRPDSGTKNLRTLSEPGRDIGQRSPHDRGLLWSCHPAAEAVYFFARRLGFTTRSSAVVRCATSSRVVDAIFWRGVIGNAATPRALAGWDRVLMPGRSLATKPGRAASIAPRLFAGARDLIRTRVQRVVN